MLSHKEALAHIISRISNITPVGMPIGIASCRTCRICLCVYPTLLTILHDKCSTMILTTHLHGEFLWIGSVCRVTVDTVSRNSTLTNNAEFIEVTKVALIDAQIATHLIPRRYASVGKSPVVKTVSAHKNLKVAILFPTAILLCAHRKSYISTLILFC